MNWHKSSFYQKVEVIGSLLQQGLTHEQVGSKVNACEETVRRFCVKNNLVGRSRGAQPKNQNAMVHGQGRNTVMRLAKRVVKEDGRSLAICERCNLTSTFEAHPIHHKDRDRSNNIPRNLEVLCRTCHTKEHSKDSPRGADGRFV